MERVPDKILVREKEESWGTNFRITKEVSPAHAPHPPNHTLDLPPHTEDKSTALATVHIQGWM